MFPRSLRICCSCSWLFVDCVFVLLCYCQVRLIEAYMILEGSASLFKESFQLSFHFFLLLILYKKFLKDNGMPD